MTRNSMQKMLNRISRLFHFLSRHFLGLESMTPITAISAFASNKSFFTGILGRKNAVTAMGRIKG